MQLALPSATGLADSCLLYKIKSTPGANNWQHQHIIPEPTCSDSPSHCLVSRASFLIRFSILYPQGGSRSLWFNLLHKCLRRYPNRWISVKKRKNKRTLPGGRTPIFHFTLERVTNCATESYDHVAPQDYLQSRSFLFSRFKNYAQSKTYPNYCDGDSCIYFRLNIAL